jgi:O-methyltransferase involved in polyketide biosynthesis
LDFDRDDLRSILAAQGYSATKRTFFVLEAVTQYLVEQGVRATFDWLAKAAPGTLRSRPLAVQFIADDSQACRARSFNWRFV